MLPSNLIVVIKMEVEFHFYEAQCMMRKILPSFEVLNKFSKCRLLKLSSMMRRKRFFLKCWFKEISKSHDAWKTSTVQRPCARCLSCRNSFNRRIEVLKSFSKHRWSWWRLFSNVEAVVFFKCFFTQVDIFKVLELRRGDESIQKSMTSVTCKSSSL